MAALSSAQVYNAIDKAHPSSEAATPASRSEGLVEEKKACRRTVSFVILDDLEPYSGPIHAEISTLEDVKSFLHRVKKEHEEDTVLGPQGRKGDPTGILKTWTDEHVEKLSQQLTTDGYLVWNRCEKYYVLAFAIDYMRFEVYSKDYMKKLIKWRDNDEGDPVVHQVVDPDYHVSPVIRLLAAINELKL